MKLAKVNKTITVDPVKMSLFENTKNIHGLNISDFVDQKLEEFLNSSSPDEMQKIRIQNLKAELLEAEHSLPEIEFMMKMRRQQQNIREKEHGAQDNNEEELQAKYEKHGRSIAIQINNRSIDWKTIKTLFEVKSETEIEKYVTQKLREDGLIGCANCRKWDDGRCKVSRQPCDAEFTCRNFSKTRA